MDAAIGLINAQPRPAACSRTTIPKATAALTLTARDDVATAATVIHAANQAEVEEEATLEATIAVLPMVDETRVPTTTVDNTTAMNEMNMTKEITGIVEEPTTETLAERSKQPTIKDIRQPQTAS